MNNIFLICWLIIILYLCTYIIYGYLLIIKASRGRLLDLRRKNLQSSVERHITVLIYANQISDNLINLLNVLQNQNYPKDKYSINAVLDSNTSGNEKVLELVQDIKIWKLVSSNHSLGIYPTISKFLEKNMATEYTNAFVLLNGTNIVKNNFLERVNIALENNSVSQACIATKSPYSTLYNTIGYLINRISNRTYNSGSYHMGNGSMLFPSGLVVTQEFLEKHPLNLSPLESEIDYNFRLLAEKQKVNWAPEVIIYNKIAEDIQDLAYWKAENFIKKIKAIRNNIKIILKSKDCMGHALYLLNPGRLFIVAITLIAIVTGFLSPLDEAGFYIWFSIPVTLLILSVISDFVALSVARCNKKDFKIWLISLFTFFPDQFYTILYYLKISNLNYSLKQIFKKMSPETEFTLQKTFKKLQRDIVVSDGNKHINCSIEIKSDQWQNQVSLIFKKKKFTTDSYETLDQAFEELQSKLASRKFRIISCYNCGYFSFSHLSHNQSSGKEGHCFYGKEGQQIMLNETIPIWHICDAYRPLEERIQILENWKNSLTENNEETD